MSEIHISLTAEKIFEAGMGIQITNSILTTWIAMTILLLFSIAATYRLRLIPSNLQQIGEIVVEGLYNLFQSILQDKTKIFFPLVATYFLYIITVNWIGLLPGVGTIGIYALKEGHQAFVPLFRSGTADLNTTLGLALISILVIQISGFKTLGFSYLRKFFNFKNPIYFFVGILELVSEFSKILSFAFRLFGNIFAGEVLLTVIAFLIPIMAPIPFLGMELFVGFIQAMVFSMLTSVFLSLALAKEGH